ncbi:OLC1v1019134C1 [Oldenlandia corymbosa var. corymbosa]|uniref:OLC1v1019134C1 n=1 Tax=Oldenlandia corymbosa var. corymbosa TaxID=529605 RepID=A0AAV1EDB8_OLDCO|nr:OLC1v1019134C1 [Oldenlandia corymbosa var. corymbosa]
MTFERVIEGGPLVEILKISNCWDALNFKVSNLHKLREIDIMLSQHQTVEVAETPNLESVDCYCEDSDWKEEEDPERLNIAVFEYGNHVYHERMRKMMMPKVSFTGVSSNKWISLIEFESRIDMDTSWFVQLKGFLTALKGSEISIIVDFPKNVVFYLVDAQKSNSVAHPCPEIREFYIEIIRPEEFSASSTHESPQTESALSANQSAILQGILWICRPGTIRYQCGYNRQELSKRFYNILTLKSYGARTSFFQLANLWEVTDIEIVGGELDISGIRYTQRERVCRYVSHFPNSRNS